MKSSMDSKRDAIVNQKNSAPQSDNADPYFSSYGELSVHELMLKDKPRTLAYKNFIISNSHLFRDRVVLDVGAGTGILSLFSAKAGARKVYAVEASGMSEACEEIIKHNNLDSVITVIKDKVENIELPEVDIIVSEWMGFYLFHESMLDSVIYARDKFLSESGLILPSTASLYLCPVSMEQYVETHFDFWKDVYGFDFSPLIPKAVSSALHQPCITVIEGHQCLSDPGKVIDIDMKTVSMEEVANMSQKLSFYIEKDGTLHGFVCWFDVNFEASRSLDSRGDSVTMPVKLSTSPACEETHWKQTVLFLPASPSVEEGDVMHCKIELSQDLANKRHYNIAIEMMEAMDDDEQESSDDDENLEEDDVPSHPVPCNCERGRCKIIRAIVEQYDEEHDEIEDEIETVEINAEKEAARTIDKEGL